MTDDPHIIEEKIVAPATEAAHPAASKPPVEQPPAEPEAPLVPPTSPLPPGAKPDLSADIANILKNIKLPERHHEVPTLVPEGQAPALGVLPTVLQGPTAAPEAEIPKMVVPPLPPSTEKDEGGIASPVVSLHTMKSDLQDVVRDKKISIVRAASMEQDRHRNQQAPVFEAPPVSGSGRKIALMLAAVLVFAGLGAAAIFGISTLMHGSSPAPAAALPSILFAENQIALPLDGQSSSGVRQNLASLLASSQGSVGSITQVVPVITTSDPSTTQQSQRPATLTEFFAALGAHPPDDLLRALSSDFFFGVHAADVPAPVFVIPVVSYDRAFAGMLAWEASIDSDLSPLFKQIPAVTAGEGGLPVERQFADLVIRNYDARALKDDSGSVVLYYAFPTPNLLIIAASPYTFPEVLSRLQAERKL